MKKVITILIILALILSLSASSFAADDEDPAIAALRYSLNGGFRDHFEIREIGRLVVVDVWAEGGVSDVLKAAQGDAASLAAWNSLVEQLLDAQPLLQDLFDKDPEDGRILILNFVSETNHGSVLLSISEGEVISNLVS